MKLVRGFCGFLVFAFVGFIHFFFAIFYDQEGCPLCRWADARLGS